MLVKSTTCFFNLFLTNEFSSGFFLDLCSGESAKEEGIRGHPREEGGGGLGRVGVVQEEVRALGQGELRSHRSGWL